MQENKKSNFFFSTCKHIKGIFSHKRKVINKTIIAPAHYTNSCFANAAIGALSNLTDISELSDGLTRTKKIGNHEFEIIDDSKDFANKMKTCDTRIKILNDLKDVKRGKRNKMSKESLSQIGYSGKSGNSDSAFCKLRDKLGLPENFQYVELRKVPTEPKENLDFGLLFHSLKTRNVTYLLTDFYGFDSKLNHVYCLHQVINGNNVNYYIANDKGKWLNYSANTKEITENDAHSLIRKKCIGYFTILAGSELAAQKKKYEITTELQEQIDDNKDAF